MAQIQLWYGDRQTFARGGLPQRWINILGRIARPKEGSGLAYSLNDADFMPLSIGPDLRRLPGIGDFNVEIDHADLEPGENDVILRLTREDGETEETRVTVVYEGNARADLPFSVRWEAGRWPPGVQVVDGLWQVQDGHVVPLETGYDRVLALGDMEWPDYEVCVPVTMYGHSADCYASPSHGYAVGFVVRWCGHHDRGADAYCSGQPRYAWYPAGALAVIRGKHGVPQRLALNGYDGLKPLAEHHFPEGQEIPIGVPYVLSLSVSSRPDGPSHYVFRVWPQGDDEASAWTLEGDGQEEELKRGAVVLFSHHLACALGPVDVRPCG
ncbi:MAG: hypothetical protein KAX44_05300 [Candidatus Brocadiae bacterium]|nr:hypothetical protein [Candidatus Brocadiia bacterium]